jgi:hypothetical protein
MTPNSSRPSAYLPSKVALMENLLFFGYIKDRGRDEALSPFSQADIGHYAVLKLGISEITTARLEGVAASYSTRRLRHHFQYGERS